MATVTAVTRKTELQSEIAAIERKQNEATAALASLNGRLDGEKSVLATKQHLYAKTCREEALLAPNDTSREGRATVATREQLDKDIASANARISGLNSLIAEAQSRVRQIGEQLQPLYDETNALAHAEDVDRWKREEQESFQRARHLLLTIFQAQREFGLEIARLRGEYFAQDAGVHSAASNHATELEAAQNGMRVSEVFSATELKSIGIKL